MLALNESITHNNAMTDTAKILVVDDESNILDVLELYLLREGYKVIRASDGATALTLYAEHKPDLVVLDVMLPQVNGLEVLKKLRLQANRPGNRPTPVIMLTA